MKLLGLTIIMTVFVGLLLPAGTTAQAIGKSESVILLHGIARSSGQMEELGKFLENKGYVVHNLDYPSTEYPLQELVNILHSRIQPLVVDAQKVNFVGYSMGGLLTRAYLNRFRPANLGRVVQLASPNNGSEVADVLKDTWVYGEIFGPAGQQLTTGNAGNPEFLGAIDYELGVIAGNSTIDPISSAIIPGDDDGKVSVASTKVDGMKEHVVIATTHTFAPLNPKAQQYIFLFLKHGTFHPAAQN